MNKTVINKVKRIFNKSGLYTTYNLNEGVLKVEVCDGINSSMDEAISETKEEVNRLLRSFKLSKDSVVIKEDGTLVLNSFEFSPVEMKTAFSQSNLVGLMKTSKKGLEINSCDFRLPLKVRYKNKKQESLKLFQSTLKEAVLKGYVKSDANIKKEEDVRTGTSFFLIEI